MRNRSKTLFYIVTIMLIVFLTSLVYNNTKFAAKFNSVKDLIGSITAIIGVIAIWYQMKREKDLTEAEFISNLNITFTTNPDIKYIYSKIQKTKNAKSNPFDEDDMPKIVDYLTFFETISNLIQRRVINFDLINNLFSYRFFTIVHNVHIQDKEIIPDSCYYENLYTLHKLWVQYRRSNNLPIPEEKFSLEIRDKNYAIHARRSKYELKNRIRLFKSKKTNSVLGDNM